MRIDCLKEEEKLFSFEMQSILIFLKSLCMRFCLDYNLLKFLPASPTHEYGCLNLSVLFSEYETRGRIAPDVREIYSKGAREKMERGGETKGVGCLCCFR